MNDYPIEMKYEPRWDYNATIEFADPDIELPNEVQWEIIERVRDLIAEIVEDYGGDITTSGIGRYRLPEEST